jgi:hypothetical protein
LVPILSRMTLGVCAEYTRMWEVLRWYVARVAEIQMRELFRYKDAELPFSEELSTPASQTRSD